MSIASAVWFTKNRFICIMHTKPAFLFFLLGILYLNLAKAQSFSGPESVEFDSTSSCYFISNTTSHQILKRTPNGTLQVFATLTGSGPHGLEIAEGKLFACNGASVKVLNLTTGAQMANIPISGATFLNGITHIDNGSVYATDFSAKKIFRINPITYAYNVFVANTTQTPNGIVYDFINNRLVYATWGASARIKAVSLSDSSQTNLVTTTLSNIDGICMDTLANLFVTNWGSNSLVMLPAPSYAPQVTLLTGLSNPADICYNFRGDTIGIPNAGNNTVVYYRSLITGRQPQLKRTSERFTGNTLTLSYPANLLFYNISGVLVQERTLMPGTHHLQSDNLPRGLYLVRIREQGKEELTGTVYLGQ